MDDSNSSGNATTPFISDFNLDFIEHDHLTYNHVIDHMLRVSDQNFDPLIVSDNYSNNFFPLSQDHHQNINVFNNHFNSPTMSCTNNDNSNSLLHNNNNNNNNNSFSGFEGETNNNVRGDDDGEDDDDDDDDNYMEGEHYSSAATKGTSSSSKKGKMDRSRTLISERKRRGRMKEKLYALRALVPNITKMDKASIVGDAVLYVQDMQMQSKKLKSQIEDLESSLRAAERSQGFCDSQTNNNSSLSHYLPVCKIIMQLDVHQIEEREFYVKVVSNKGQGVAASLYKALDSLSSFIIRNSSLSTLYDQFVFTFTLNVAKSMEEFNLPNMKVWISGALLNQGFEFQAF